MDNYLQHLQNRAHFFKNELSQHAVFQKYWNRLALIMKGSVARGYADKYSDIDFVIFSDRATKNDIVSDFVASGISQRKDGVFLPLNDEWEGHYNLDTYEDLEAHFAAGDMVTVWEYSNVMIMHDSQNRYDTLIATNTKKLFDNINELIKSKYLEIQLYLDWLRQPLRRADVCASIQYAAHIQRYCAHIMFLLDNQGYPPDKWLFYYLKDTGVSYSLHTKIIDYSKTICGAAALKPDMELTEYEIYVQALAIVEDIINVLKNRYGCEQWIDEWYLYA